MKVISGGKQLSLIRDTEEVIKFLSHTARTGSLPSDEIDARIQACENCFSKLTEEQDNVSWILRNLNSLIGTEPAETQERVKNALEDYQFWSSDPFGWERHHQDYSPTPIKQKSNPPAKTLEKTLTFPINKNQCIEVKIPEGGISTEEFLRLGLFLYPYCNDLDLTKSFSWIRDPEKN